LYARVTRGIQCKRRAKPNLFRIYSPGRDLGRLGLQTEDHWGTSYENMPQTLLMSDLRHAFRNLYRNPGLAAAVVLTLALGIGVNTTMFALMDQILIRALPFPDPQQLVQLQDVQGKDLTVASLPELMDWRAETRLFSIVAGQFTFPRSLMGRDEPTRVRCSVISRDYLSMFGWRTAAGRGFSDSDHQKSAAPVVILSYGFWQSQFGGSSDIIGRPIALAGSAPTVIGVLAPVSGPLAAPADIWMPLEQAPPFTNRGSHYLTVFARLQPGISLDTALSQLPAIGRRLDESAKNGHFISISPLRDFVAGGNAPRLYALFGATALVLLIATVNVTNLMLGRAFSRSREFSIRMSLGATRMHLLRHTLIESLVLGLFGGVAALMLAAWSSDALRAVLSADGLNLTANSLDGRAIAFASLVTILAASAAGAIPGLRIRKMMIRGPERGSVTGRLVVAEVALATVALTGAILLSESLWRLMRVETGFRSENVLTMNVTLPATGYPQPEQKVAFFDSALGSIARLPGVDAAGAVLNLPLAGGMNGSFKVEGIDLPSAGSELHTEKIVATPGYLRAMGLRLIRGRWFDEGDRRGSTQVAVVSESFARRFWPGQDPLGRHIDVAFSDQRSWQEIVGVVADMKLDGLDRAAPFEAFVPFTQSTSSNMSLVVRTAGDPAQATASVRAAVRALDRLPLITDVRTMPAVLGASVAGPRISSLLLASFASLALLLAGIGVYAMMAHEVATRRREIGIRAALGAGRASIVQHILSRGMRLAGVGVALGAACSLAAGRLLHGLLFGVSDHDPVAFVLVVLIVPLISAMACLVPARRAAAVDPAVTLRVE
jgi:putative ABC transport system permease protein